MRVNFAQECRNEATESIYIYIDNLYVYVYSSYLIKSVLNLQIQKHLISDENKGYKRNSINTWDQQGKKTRPWLLQCSKSKLLAGTNRLLQVCGDIEFWKFLEDWKCTVYTRWLYMVVFAANHSTAWLNSAVPTHSFFYKYVIILIISNNYIDLYNYVYIPSMGLDKIERHTLPWEVAPLNSQSRNRFASKPN